MAVARDYLLLELGTQIDPGPLRDISLSAGGQLAAGEDGNGGEDIAYVCTYDAILTAFRFDDGRTLWKSPVVQGLAPGAGCSLQALDGMVLSQVPHQDAHGNLVSNIVARRAGDGHMLWQEPIGLGIYRGGVEYYLDRPTLQVVAYRAVDGAVLWRYPYPADRDLSLLAAGGGLVLARSSGTWSDTPSSTPRHGHAQLPAGARRAGWPPLLADAA
jgi:hypothetical protein